MEILETFIMWERKTQNWRQSNQVADYYAKYEAFMNLLLISDNVVWTARWKEGLSSSLCADKVHKTAVSPLSYNGLFACCALL